MLIRGIFSLLSIVLICSPVRINQSTVESSDQMGQDFFHRNHWVDSVYHSLTLEEKIGQFFMVAVYSRDGKAHKQDILDLVTDHGIGGVIFFQGSPGKQAIWTNELQDSAEVPLLVAIDGEWGLSMRLDSTIEYPRQLTLGAISDDELIYDMGYEIGLQCRRIGVNINLAPVADINNNPNNPVINDRSFGEDKYNVALKSLAYMEGLQDAGVMACAKHFPGHGDTDKDSHKTLPQINHSVAHLQETELYPFKILFNNGISSVMAAHLFIPSIDSTPNLAVSLSRKATTWFLKDTLGYEGLVFSDALNMKGVSDYYEPGEVDLKAFIAGNDILLFSQDVPTGIAKIKQALEDSVISEKEFSTRLRKVLSAKYYLGLNEYEPARTDSIYQDLNQWDAKFLRQRLYESSITLVNNKNEMLPFKVMKPERMATISFGTGKRTIFQNMLANYYPMDHYQLSKNALKKDYNWVEFMVDSMDYTKVFVSFHNMSKYNSKHYGLAGGALSLMDSLAADRDVIATAFGSPYSLKHFNSVDWLLTTYEENATTQSLAAQAIFGGIPVKGKLPVTANWKYKLGQGYVSDTTLRLKFTVPEEVGMSSKDLKSIDYIAHEAIAVKATPGCQIAVVKDGKVIYNKSFGHHTYEAERPVRNSHVYDLASITKVASTLLGIIYYYDRDKVELDGTLADYLDHLPSNSSVNEITIKELLLHEAGLEGWIPFFQFVTTNDTVYDYYLCDDTTGGFTIPVADSLYLYHAHMPKMWHRVYTSYVAENRKYKYSDLSFYLLRAVVEQFSGLTIDTFTRRVMYDPMGLGYLRYNPTTYFDHSQIPPTEWDSSFRKQLVHGHVHDPGAAMTAGVGGHAGLFSNATDLAALMYMLNNNGQYGGKQYLETSSINHFSLRHSSTSRRGLGFDKPQTDATKDGPTAALAPESVYGHTGFTGTCAWVDPENDLVYVFLSNRVYPDAGNWKLVNKGIRTRIQKVIYQALENGKEPFVVREIPE